jgi:anti-sigma28 factor (negative regulator of flagellin synthesis)
MIIDPIRSFSNEIISDQNTKHVKERQGGSSAEKLGVRTTLFSDSAAVGSLVAQAMDVPAVRLDKVAALQVSVRSGSYPIEPRQIAAAMLRELR